MISNWEMIQRLLIAAALGGAIGVERERLLWAAGLRTHRLVCIGSCLIVIVSASGFRDVIGPGVVLDPSRIAAQVVSGVGFVGAGTILFRGEAVKGLTAAASLWAVAGVGPAVGAGLYAAGFAVTIILLSVLAGIKPIEERFRNRIETWTLVVVARRHDRHPESGRRTSGAGHPSVSARASPRSALRVDRLDAVRPAPLLDASPIPGCPSRNATPARRVRNADVGLDPRPLVRIATPAASKVLEARLVI